MGGIGDFAEMLINQQMAGTSPSVQKASNVKQRDISRVEVPNDMMRDILSESFDVKVPEQEEVMEETVETTVQPINEDMLLTESTAKELIHSIQELKELLSEMTTAGMVAASALPINNSKVVIGVAKSGSRVRVDFSPTMLYDAKVMGTIMGTIINRSMNWETMKYCIHSSPFIFSQTPAKFGGKSEVIAADSVIASPLEPIV